MLVYSNHIKLAFAIAENSPNKKMKTAISEKLLFVVAEKN